MIQTVVFDFGQVLVKFDPPSMTASHIADPDDCALVTEILFDRLYWDALDAGTISDEAALEAICTRLPSRLHETACTIYWQWIAMLPEIEGMDALLEDLKASGTPLYLLSNISRYFADHHKTIPILRHFDGCIFSAVCGMVKPSRDIFAHLCETYHCDPTTTLFIDDSEKNIQGAKAFGLQGYLFDGDASKLRHFLIENGVL